MDLQKKNKFIGGHMEEMHVRSMSWVVWELECCMSRESLNVKGPQGLSFHWGHIIGQTTEIATSLRPPPNCWAPAAPGGLPLGLLFGALLSELCIHLYSISEPHSFCYMEKKLEVSLAIVTMMRKKSVSFTSERTCSLWRSSCLDEVN